MNTYGIIAIDAAVSLSNNAYLSPENAWNNAAKIHFPHSIDSQNKPCPMATFLSLCEQGYIAGIKSGYYTKSKKNKAYAIEAVKLLRNGIASNLTAKELWNMVLKNLHQDENKTSSAQMNVVLALWDKGKIVKTY